MPKDQYKDELSYQKRYARTARNRADKRGTKGEISSSEEQKQKEVFDRVIEGRTRKQKKKPAKKSSKKTGFSELVEGLKMIGSRAKGGYGSLQKMGKQD